MVSAFYFLFRKFLFIPKSQTYFPSETLFPGSWTEWPTPTPDSALPRVHPSLRNTDDRPSDFSTYSF